jgi:hypothetical protein
MVDSATLERVHRKFAALCCSIFAVGICCNNYEGILAKLNLSTLYSKWWHLNAHFLINVFKNKIVLPYLILSTCVCVSIYIYIYIYLQNYTCMVNLNFKTSNSARCFSTANAICKDIDIFYKDYMSIPLRDVL